MCPSVDCSRGEPVDEPVTREALLRLIALLERIDGQRGLLLDLSREERGRLLQAAGRVAHPGRGARREILRAQRRKQRSERAAKKSRDEVTLAATGIRQMAAAGQRTLPAPPRPFETPLAPPAATHDPRQFCGRLQQPRNCYICKRYYDQVHFFYDALCPDCAAFNWQKRHQSADLTGRFALLTGGRVKIGHQAALKLLRAGAEVIVTTRFPRDAAQRFLAHADSHQWRGRLQIHGLDLRHLPSIEALAEHLCQTLPRLDFILNNACQTVRRPPGFYAHLMQAETGPSAELPPAARQMLESHQRLASRRLGMGGQEGDCPTADRQALPGEVDALLAGIAQAAERSQLALTVEDGQPAEALFPAGQLDSDCQQVDLRAVNSWRLRLAEVPTVELLEVQLVNAIAPFMLNARLKPLMVRVPSRDKQIVNVSAMEGIFYRAFKRDTHPHTNMAKAALNMMTRTSAADYIRDGIHMNSVDTGWITDEDPAAISQRKRQELNFFPPLDQVDAAARICDPVFCGLRQGHFVWGKFLKDYQVANW